MATTTVNKVWKMSNGRYRLVKASDLDRNRIRFNSGYHDGAFDRQHNHTRPDGLTHETILLRHFDAVYAVGYYYGWMDADYERYEKDSSSAWLDALANGEVSDGISDYRNIASAF